jgi:hypothetical protein
MQCAGIREPVSKSQMIGGGRAGRSRCEMRGCSGAGARMLDRRLDGSASSCRGLGSHFRKSSRSSWDLESS